MHYFSKGLEINDSNARKRRDSNPRAALATYTLSRGASSANLSTFPMAPQVGLEPTTDRLTADSSTTELLWNNYNGAGDGNRTHNISLEG